MHPLRKNRPLRRIVLAGAATVSTMVLLLSLKPHTTPAPEPTSATSSTVSSGSTAPAPTRSGTVTGDTVQTRWGPVRVRVTLQGGKFTDVNAVDYPQGNPRDQEINSYALPQLRREALAAQSADIDMVSGATYTSDGYRRSLQSALDSAAL